MTTDVVTTVVAQLVAKAVNPDEQRVREILRDNSIVTREDDFDRIFLEVQQQLNGYGPLEQLFNSDVTDVLVMPDQSVCISGWVCHINSSSTLNSTTTG